LGLFANYEVVTMGVIDEYNDGVVPIHYKIDRVRLLRDEPPIELPGQWRVIVYSLDRTELRTLHAAYQPSQAVVDAIVADYQAFATQIESATGLTPLPPEPEE
jgi:hypothetical protein